jgi:hypothetical protein
MQLVAALVVTLALVSGLEFPGAKKDANTWKLDQSLVLEDSSMLTMRIALAPNNAAELTSKVHSIADPKSSNFRKYLNNKQLTELVGVSQSDMDRVLAWAKKSNFDVVEVPLNRDWVTVRASAAAIETGLKTKLATWTNVVNGQVNFMLAFIIFSNGVLFSPTIFAEKDRRCGVLHHPRRPRRRDPGMIFLSLSCMAGGYNLIISNFFLRAVHPRPDLVLLRQLETSGAVRRLPLRQGGRRRARLHHPRHHLQDLPGTLPLRAQLPRVIGLRCN